MNSVRYCFYSVLMFLLGGLAGCGQQSSENLHNILSFQTNAHFAAYSDGANGSWEPAVFNNPDFNPEQRNYTLDDPNSRYRLAFACPSSHENEPHKVVVYLFTAGEARINNHLCRIPEARREIKSYYGTIYKTLNNDEALTDYQDEMVLLSFSRDVWFTAYEGYATKVYNADRDILGYKGPLDSDTNNIIPTYFFRQSVSHNNKLIKHDIHFDGTDSSKVVAATSGDVAQVTIQGVAADESVDSVVGFSSENGTFLPLTRSQDKSFSYRGVPPTYKKTNKNREYIEGHELHVALGNNNVLTRYVWNFFSEQKDITVRVPSLPTDLPEIVAWNRENFRHVSIKVPKYKDNYYGSGAVYELSLVGTSAYDGKEPPLTNGVEWVIYVSRDWLAQVGGEITLPDLRSLKGWSHDWDFKVETPVLLRSVSYASKFNSGDVLNFIKDKEFVDGMSFGQVYQYAVAEEVRQ